jgi:thiol-disulfide isomerase/thioredoxin
MARFVSLFFVTLAMVCQGALARPVGEVPQGGVLGELLLTGLNTPDKKLSQYRGKPLIINVWASWCGPCRQEMPSVERMAWSDKASKWTVIGISTDDHVVAAKGFLRHANATLNHYIDKELQAEAMLGADRLPLTVVVDAQGRVRNKWYGAKEWDSPQALQWIEASLQGQPPVRN